MNYRAMYVATWIAFLRTQGILPQDLRDQWGTHRATIWQWETGRRPVSRRFQPRLRAIIVRAMEGMVRHAWSRDGMERELATWVTRWEEEVFDHRGHVAAQSVQAMITFAHLPSQDLSALSQEELAHYGAAKCAIARWVCLKRQGPLPPRTGLNDVLAIAMRDRIPFEETLARFNALWEWHTEYRPLRRPQWIDEYEAGGAHYRL